MTDTTQSAIPAGEWEKFDGSESSSLFRAALESSYDSVLITDANAKDPKIVFVNSAFSRMTGYSREEMMGQSPKILQGERTDRTQTRALREALERGESFEANTVNYRKNGETFHIQWRTSPVTDESGQVTHYIAIQRDVTDDVHLIQRLKRKAEMDGLTRLLTRDAGSAEFNGLLAESRKTGKPLSVVVIDIDHFKEVNDEHGHLVGDRVLRRVGRLIDGRTRGNDLCIRWGGEEFIVVLAETPLAGAVQVAESIRSAVADEPMDNGISVTVSCGVAQCRVGEKAARTLKRADDALYRAKNSGRNCTHTETSEED